MINKETSFVKITLEESPYGDKGKTYDGMLGMINHWILQLQHFRQQPAQTSAGIEAIDADIAGYQEVLDSGKEENAQTFLKIKEKGYRGLMKPFKDNKAIVQHMKESGLWVEAD